MSPTRKQPLHDEAIDAHVDWCEACLGVQAAYDRWATAARSQAGVAFRDYQHALVREEHASLKYALLVRSSLT